MIGPVAALPAPGPRLHRDGCAFTVWAPAAENVTLRLAGDHHARIPMRRECHGFHAANVEGVRAGARYAFLLGDDPRELPDPASRLQPDGVHARSAVVSHMFDWTDVGWRPPRIEDLIIYELHVGTFTPVGTLDAAARCLPALRDLGVNVVELMPISEFPGARNWGYDGVYPYAVHHAYGGPGGLKRFVDAAHCAGIAVHLDVVYNHLGPEGNYLGSFGPYFTSRYATPWGGALNFDGADSDPVRDFFIRSAVRWIEEFHIDGLRIDAVHAIVDTSARPFLLELTERVHAAGRAARRDVAVIAESDLGDPRVIREPEHGGLGMDGLWLDDFHHSLHTVVTGESHGYYADFGALDHLAAAYRQGFVYTGQYSGFRRRRHGSPARSAHPEQFVVFAQNHDQIGNRMSGDRLAATLGFDKLRLLAAAVNLSPFLPLLFMGEEYGETAPFPYFVSHGDPDLVEAVRHGRRAEFAAFDWLGEPPDPQAIETFTSARLDRSLADRPGHRELLAFNRRLLSLRRELRLGGAPFPEVEHDAARGWIRLLRRIEYSTAPATVTILNFGVERASVPLPPGRWQCILDSSDPAWAGTGANRSADPLVATATIEMEPLTAMLLSNDD